MTAEDSVIRELAEGTAAHTGSAFFTALVKHLCGALGIAGAWVTELSPDRSRLRAFSFWFQDRYITDYEYALAGTPCAPVIESRTLVHVPDNVVQLYPGDKDLPPLGAVSYLGLPLLDTDGSVLGHLGALDVKPLPLTDRVEAIFRIFGARAAAEVQRLRSEERTRERERELSSVLDSTWEAIVVLDEAGRICHANRCSLEKLGRACEGVQLAQFLSPDSAERWHSGGSLIRDLEVVSGGRGFPADASVSAFTRDGRPYRTVILRDLREQREAESRMAALEEELADARPVGQLIGESPAMRRVFSQVRQVAPSDASVLILGESGTGKELVARAIHEASPRRAKAMVRVNCGAIPSALMESEFFGHERGAFTGATERRDGRFALADGGTLFLDEVGELPLELQVKLLRVLQEGEFEAVGSARTRKVDVRIVAATNRDLAKEVERGRFRADLFYRLNVFPILLPALRERGADVELLADAIVERFAKKMGRRFRPLPRAAKDQLRSHHWPGNVRELENILERAAILARGDELTLESRALPAPPPAVASPAPVLSADQLLALERENTIRALESCGWRVAGDSGAAKLLGVAPSTLTSRMKALGISRLAKTRES